MSNKIVQRGWRPLQPKAGLVDPDGKSRFSFHTSRHFFASWAIEQGFTPKKLQALLAHSSIQITLDHYGHLFPSLEDDHAKFAKGVVGLVVCRILSDQAATQPSRTTIEIVETLRF